VRVQGGGRDGRIYLQPGRWAFRPRFIRLANDFDLTNSSIERRQDDGKVTFIPVDLRAWWKAIQPTMVLKSGDVINIPRLQDVVFVAGEVVAPGGQEFQRGLPPGATSRWRAARRSGQHRQTRDHDDHGHRRDANRDSAVYRGETVLVKRQPAWFSVACFSDSSV
jgi:hypothetical protein